MNMPHSKRVSAVAVALLAAAVLVTFPATSGAADLYDDEDSHPLRIASYFIQPVAKVVEWTVMRPLHFVGSRVAPEHSYGGEPNYLCQRERPSRRCTSEHGY